mgnify:CR=1 FL=1
MAEKIKMSDKIKIDFSLINDMNYYNGITFSGFVPGVPCSILSGGRYDNLLGYFGKKSSAIGFAVVIDDLMLALGRQREPKVTEDTLPVTVTYSEADYSEKLKEAKALRQKGIRTVLVPAYHCNK